MQPNRHSRNPAAAASDQIKGAEHKDDWRPSRHQLERRAPATAVLTRAGDLAVFSVLGSISLVCGRWCADSAACVAEWRRRARSRGDLMALGERELSDMYLTRCDALHEASKPFWRK